MVCALMPHSLTRENISWPKGCRQFWNMFREKIYVILRKICHMEMIFVLKRVNQWERLSKWLIVELQLKASNSPSIVVVDGSGVFPIQDRPFDTKHDTRAVQELHRAHDCTSTQHDHRFWQNHGEASIFYDWNIGHLLWILYQVLFCINASKEF